MENRFLPIPPPAYTLLFQYGGLVMQQSTEFDGNWRRTSKASPTKNNGDLESLDM